MTPELELLLITLLLIVSAGLQLISFDLGIAYVQRKRQRLEVQRRNNTHPTPCPDPN